MHFEDHTTGTKTASAKEELQFHSSASSLAKSLLSEACHYLGLPGNEGSVLGGSTM
jgi:hypothetical protein